jgi:hypothetical protein
MGSIYIKDDIKMEAVQQEEAKMPIKMKEIKKIKEDSEDEDLSGEDVDSDELEDNIRGLHKM